MAVVIEGLDDLFKSLDLENKEIADAAFRGIKKAVIIVEEQAVQITPIDTGTLRNSSYNRAYKTESDVMVGEVGFTANYALYVHEMPTTRTGENKFLEKALRRNSSRIYNTIKNEVSEAI